MSAAQYLDVRQRIGHHRKRAAAAGDAGVADADQRGDGGLDERDADVERDRAATSYDVSFGTTNPPPQVTTSQAAASYQPATTAAGTTYYWRVVARNGAGTTTGPVWSFTTASAPADAGDADADERCDGCGDDRDADVERAGRDVV